MTSRSGATAPDSPEITANPALTGNPALTATTAYPSNPDDEYADHPAPAQAVIAYGAGDAAAIPGPGSAEPGAPTQLPASPARAKATLIASSSAAFLLVTNEIAPLGLIARISEDLGRSPSQVGFMSTAFAFTVMVSSIPLARLTTSWTRKPAVLSALAVWTLGTLVVVMSQGFAQLLIGRGLVGLGHALFWAVAPPVIAGMFPPEIRGRCVARLLLGASAAGIVGLPTATWLAQQTEWRVPFMALAIGGAILAVTIAIVMPSFKTTQGTAERGQYPSLRRFIRVLAVTLLVTTSMATTFTYITPFFTDVAGFAESTVPILLGIGGAVGVVSMWLVGRFLDRYPIRSVAVGMVLIGMMWVGFALLGQFQAVSIAMIAVQGFSWSIVVAGMINWAIRHSPWVTDVGVATYNSTFNAGNTVGSVLGAGILAWWGAQWLPVASLVLVSAGVVLVWQVRPMLRFWRVERR
jgi:predicted MFS family arabinose efflux permease